VSEQDFCNNIIKEINYRKQSLLSQFLSKVTVTSYSFYFKCSMCFCLAAGRHTLKMCCYFSVAAFKTWILQR